MQTFSLPKTEFSQEKTKKLQPVIVKGFRGEPARLDAVNIGKNFIIVVGKSGKTQMKLKDKYVYQYNEETYQKLRNAFDSNNSEILEQEWQKAKPIILT